MLVSMSTMRNSKSGNLNEHDPSIASSFVWLLMLFSFCIRASWVFGEQVHDPDDDDDDDDGARIPPGSFLSKTEVAQWWNCRCR